MVGDLLLPTRPNRLMRLTQRALVLVALAFVVGAGAVGTGSTIDAHATSADAFVSSIDSAVQSTLTADRVAEATGPEMLVDATEEAASPAIAIPQSMSPVVETSHVIMMEVTAYCACTKCCGPNAQGITASGKDVTYNDGRFVAADTSMLPFGTRLLIPGYDAQPVEVIDRGGAIKGAKLDVFYASHEEALKWGRQHIPVTVVK